VQLGSCLGGVLSLLGALDLGLPTELSSSFVGDGQECRSPAAGVLVLILRVQQCRVPDK
jgi:hypothetical protein